MSSQWGKFQQKCSDSTSNEIVTVKDICDRGITGFEVPSRFFELAI